MTEIQSEVYTDNSGVLVLGDRGWSEFKFWPEATVFRRRRRAAQHPTRTVGDCFGTQTIALLILVGDSKEASDAELLSSCYIVNSDPGAFSSNSVRVGEGGERAVRVALARP